MVRHSWKTLSRYRPRALTLLVIAAIAALLVLANLSDVVGKRLPPRSTADNWRFDVQAPPEDDPQPLTVWHLSYGWPLLWRQYVIFAAWGGPDVHECHSAGRLATNAVVWFAMLAAPAATCEWLLRRYKPRLRWSLRTMLVAFGLVAACCGWFAAARNRANIEEPLIAEARSFGHVWVERLGPDWLELLHADHLRTHIAGALVNQELDSGACVEEVLERLARLPNLQCLCLYVRQLTPGMVDALRDMRQLRALQLVFENLEGEEAAPGVADALSGALADKHQLRTLAIELDDWWNDSAPELVSQELLTAIGRLMQVETLIVKHSPRDRLDYLANLTHLKSLTLDVAPSGVVDPIATPPLLSRLPTLPHLETIGLGNSEIAHGDLRYLARLPRLRSLNLSGLHVSGAGLADLTHLGSLEELAIDSDVLSAAGLESLLALKQLRNLHVRDLDRVFGSFGARTRDRLRALESLRRANPGLIVDSNSDSPLPAFDPLHLQYGDRNRELILGSRQTVRIWKQKQQRSPPASDRK